MPPPGDGVRVERRSRGSYESGRELTLQLHGLDGSDVVADGVEVPNAGRRFTVSPFTLVEIGH